MSSVAFPSRIGVVSFDWPDSTRYQNIPSPAASMFYSLPADVIGDFVLVLSNIVAGSRYRIERQGDGSLATPTANAEGVAGSSTLTVQLDAYTNGSANNDLLIKIRKATSAPYYKPYETQTTAFVGSTPPIYVSQTPD